MDRLVEDRHVTRNDWEIPLAFQSADEAILILVLRQAQIRQTDVDQNTCTINSRVQNLLSLWVSYVIASMGFFLVHQQKFESQVIITATAVTFVYSLIVCFYLLGWAYPGNYVSAGGSPSNLFSPELLKTTKDDQKQCVYLALLHGAERRIRANRNENARRLNVVKIATWAAFGLALLLAVIYGFSLRFGGLDLALSSVGSFSSPVDRNLG